MTRRLVLASTSPYRKELLARIVNGFECCASSVDETPIAGESPAAVASRLARLKAMAVAANKPNSLVIGSDQVAELDGQLIGKPGTLALAEAQLHRCSGRTVRFHTALCIVDTASIPSVAQEMIDTTEVVFRELAPAEIARYVIADAPVDCAGSFKAERLGVALFERVESSDPSALIGLPLIALCRLLRQAGIDVP